MNCDIYTNTMPYAKKGTPERAAYETKSQELHEQFKQDLFEDLGIAANPKRHMLLSIAWDMGHSNGYSEVYNCAAQLVDLIREVPE